MTASLELKSRRLLGDGAVQVLFADEHRVTARVRSDHYGLVAVTWSRLDGWHCTCPAFGRCSHRRSRGGRDHPIAGSQPNPKIDECASARSRCTQCRSDQRTLGPVPDERRGRMARARAFSGQADERDIVDLVNDDVVGPAAYAAIARAAADEADRELGELLEAVEADLANDPGDRLVALANDWQERFGQSARQSVDP